MKVLYLTPWYPSERDAMMGLFVQKHVEAVRAQGADVQVICSQGRRDLWQQWRRLRRTWGIPDLVQLNVIQKQGVLALWLLKRFHVPYIIVEHWSGYLPANGAFACRSAGQRRIARLICRNAAAVLPVSAALEQAMRANGLQARRWLRARNVVDEFFYENPAKNQRQESKKTLVHVSCFDEAAKNVTGLLRAFRTLCEWRKDVQLVLVGTGQDIACAQQCAEELAFRKGAVTFTGELTPREVCGWLQQADAFVLSSRYETAGIVLIEAAATGTPILSTPVGLAPELVTGETGVLVPCETALRDPDRFAEGMDAVLRLPVDERTRQTLRTAAEPYRFERVGQEMMTIYKEITGL